MSHIFEDETKRTRPFSVFVNEHTFIVSIVKSQIQGANLINRN